MLNMDNPSQYIGLGYLLESRQHHYSKINLEPGFYRSVISAFNRNQFTALINDLYEARSTVCAAFAMRVSSQFSYTDHVHGSWYRTGTSVAHTNHFTSHGGGWPQPFHFARPLQPADNKTHPTISRFRSKSHLERDPQLCNARGNEAC